MHSTLRLAQDDLLLAAGLSDVPDYGPDHAPAVVDVDRVAARGQSPFACPEGNR